MADQDFEEIITERRAQMEEYRRHEIERFSEMDELDLNKYVQHKRCSNCDKWMKSSLCPREHNVRGYSKGPSADDFPCGDFEPNFRYGIALEVQTMRKLES